MGRDVGRLVRLVVLDVVTAVGLVVVVVVGLFVGFRVVGFGVGGVTGVRAGGSSLPLHWGSQEARQLEKTASF